jgi:hypothetical protein
MRVWLIPRVTALAALGVCQAAAAGPSWQLAGTTYNSVAFVDVNSVRREGKSRAFTAIRVSGQPTKDRWKSVVQKLSVNCDTRVSSTADRASRTPMGASRPTPVSVQARRR